jgi:hypothetical protein
MIKITFPVSLPRMGVTTGFLGDRQLGERYFGNSVVVLDGWAFPLLRTPARVTIGGHVRKIGDSAFYDCIVLDRLSCPKALAR